MPEQVRSRKYRMESCRNIRKFLKLKKYGGQVFCSGADHGVAIAGIDTDEGLPFECLYVTGAGGSTQVVYQPAITGEAKAYPGGGVKAGDPFFVHNPYPYSGDALFLCYLFDDGGGGFAPFICLILEADGIRHRGLPFPGNHFYCIISFLKDQLPAEAGGG